MSTPKKMMNWWHHRMDELNRLHYISSCYKNIFNVKSNESLCRCINIFNCDDVDTLLAIRKQFVGSFAWMDSILCEVTATITIIFLVLLMLLILSYYLFSFCMAVLTTKLKMYIYYLYCNKKKSWGLGKLERWEHRTLIWFRVSPSLSS